MRAAIRRAGAEGAPLRKVRPHPPLERRSDHRLNARAGQRLREPDVRELRGGGAHEERISGLECLL